MGAAPDRRWTFEGAEAAPSAAHTEGQPAQPKACSTPPRLAEGGRQERQGELQDAQVLHHDDEGTRREQSPEAPCSGPPEAAQQPVPAPRRGEPFECAGLLGGCGLPGACCAGAAPQRRAAACEVRVDAAGPARGPVTEDYDPAKPEYVQAASERQVLEAEVSLLRRQAASLEAVLEARSAGPPSEQSRAGVLVGYRRVLVETRRQLCRAVARLATLPPEALSGEEREPAGAGAPTMPQPKVSWSATEVASTRASTGAVSDPEELLLLASEASLEELERHAAGLGDGAGSCAWPERVLIQDEAWPGREVGSVEDAAVHQVCGIFGVPFSWPTLRECACRGG